MNAVIAPVVQECGLSCVFVKIYYPGFINSHYQNKPHLSSQDYATQLSELETAAFYDGDFHANALRALGWKADNLVINCEPLQSAWAREHASKYQGLELVLEQIANLRPDVVYLQDFTIASKDFMAALRPLTKLIVGQIASGIPPLADLKAFDIIISSFPHFVDHFRQMGITTYYQPWCFEPNILPRMQGLARDIEVSFVGGMSVQHVERYNMLDAVAKLPGVEYWGYGKEQLPKDSGVLACHKGDAWAIDVFKILARSKITINTHIDMAANYANNMRLYDATGCGALLITDYKDNLNEIYEIGKEVVAYRTNDECVDLIRYYQQHPEEASKIAQAGQDRTLREYTYGVVLEDTSELLQHHIDLAHKKTNTVTVNNNGRYEVNHEDSFLDASLQQQLANMYMGQLDPKFIRLEKLLKPIAKPIFNTLELGCGSAYLYEVLRYLLKANIAYIGIDQGSRLDLAKTRYPKQQFGSSLGERLPVADDSQYLVIASSLPCDLTLFKPTISELVRATDEYLMVNSLTVCREKTSYISNDSCLGKNELIVNEKELLAECLNNGLAFMNAVEMEVNSMSDNYKMSYLFKKIK